MKEKGEVLRGGHPRADVTNQGQMQPEDESGSLNIASCKTYPVSLSPRVVLTAPHLFLVMICIHIKIKFKYIHI